MSDSNRPQVTEKKKQESDPDVMIPLCTPLLHLLSLTGSFLYLDDDEGHSIPAAQLLPSELATPLSWRPVEFLALHINVSFVPGLMEHSPPSSV